MKVFISWSGAKSGEIATALGRWIHLLLPENDTWVSSDIPAGSNWASEIARRLQQARTAIICVTRENMSAPWLLFEAGALARTGRLFVYLIDLDATEVAGPLAQFHTTRGDKDGTWQLVTALNKTTKARVPERDLRHHFEQNWPRLERVLAASQTPRVETASIVFADIVGSSRLFAMGGDLAAHKSFQDFFARAKELQRSHSGQIIKFIGDGFLAIFPTVNDAFEFAVELQTSLSAKPLLVGEFSLAVRMGLHCGVIQRTETSDGGTDVAGMAINLAARITPMANPAQIVVSGDAYAELSNKQRKLLGPIEPIVVKGFENRVKISRFTPAEIAAKE